MTPSRSFGMIHMNGAPLDRRQRVLEKPALVECVGVKLNLKIEFIGDREAGIDHRRHGSPVFVNFQSDAAAGYLVMDRLWARGVAASEKAEVDRPVLRRLQHFADIEGAAAIDADCNRSQ